MIVYEQIEYSMKKNYDIYLQKTEDIDYNKISLIWSKTKKSILNIKVSDILKEIDNYISENINSFIKLIFMDQNNCIISEIFVNQPWDIIKYMI
jgi:ribulose bisphosphate carboxylase small subunit